MSAQERAAAGAATRRSRQTRVTLRKISPWSVFRFSVLFYFCGMLVLLLGGTILYFLLGLIGVLDSVTRLIQELFADKSFVISGLSLFVRGFGLGIVSVVLWSVVNLLGAVLYNLIADIVGGIEVTLGDAAGPDA